MNQLDLRQRVAVITGAARGIGYAAARRALQSGAVVSLWDVDGEKAESARQELSSLGSVSAERVELTDQASVEAAAARTVAAHGRIDILVNNAGIAGGNGLTWELDPDLWRRVIEVNLVGCFLACRAVIPHMLAGGYGRIVNVASIAGKEGNPNSSHYSASKAGLIGFTKSLAKEVGSRGITVNAIAPGFIDTRMTAGLPDGTKATILERTPLNRFGTPEDVAGAVAFLIGPDATFITGHTLTVDGGLFMP
jgi:NAD(P)-dependent dehydrogenase (short-subunit alcohol dehydrogenase family)